MRLKKIWNKPALRPLRISEQYDPADGLTREQWEAARKLQCQAEEMKKAKDDADAPP